MNAEGHLSRPSISVAWGTKDSHPLDRKAVASPCIDLHTGSADVHCELEDPLCPDFMCVNDGEGGAARRRKLMPSESPTPQVQPLSRAARVRTWSWHVLSYFNGWRRVDIRVRVAEEGAAYVPA